MKYFSLIFYFFYTFLYANDMSVGLETNYRNFKPGQPIKIKITTAQPSYVYLLVLQSDGKVNLLFPNKEENENMLLETSIQIPSEDKKYEFLAGDVYGMDVIYVIASRNRIKKLHKDKYFSKTVYKNIKYEDTSWLKKLTKHSPPDQWILAESPIFISKDGVNEQNKQNIKKESKIITTDSKQVEEPKVKRELEEDEYLSGFFKLPENARLNNKKGYFQVRKDRNSYILKLIPYVQSPDEFCEFKITKFTAPKKNTIEHGFIDANSKSCNFEDMDPELKKFWDAFKTLYLQYHYKKSGNLKAVLWLTSPNDKYKLKATKTVVRDEFNFLTK